VHPANIQDRDGVALVLDRRTRRLFPFIERIYGDDEGYSSRRCAGAERVRGGDHQWAGRWHGLASRSGGQRMSDPDSRTAVKAPLSAELLEAVVDLRVAELRVLAAQTALDYWRPRPRPPRHTIPPRRTTRSSP
jgi:hypothetical protein